MRETRETEIATSASAPPEVTVAMPARNAARFIGEAIESVLAQRGVSLELIVVDDHSDDATAAIAESFRDPRLSVLRNDRRKGIGACHNAILRAGTAPYLAHVDADDFLLPGALRKLVDALKADPTAGQAHCYFFDVDAAGRMTRESFRERWTTFYRYRTPGLDYRAALVVRSLANHLRTFPRRVLEELGGFDESLPYAVDYDMALRVVDRFEIVLVPEFLYGHRVHDSNTTESLRLKSYRLTWIKYVVRRRLVAARRIGFLTRSHFDLHRYVYHRAMRSARRWRAAAAKRIRRSWTSLRWRLLAPLGARLLRSARRRLSWWPLDWRRARHTDAPRPRLAYWLRLFPALSDTLTQREIAALIDRVPAIEVIAEEPSGVAHFDGEARRLMSRTRYLRGTDRERGEAPAWYFLRRRPLRTIHLFFYLLFRRHGASDSFAADRIIWRRALRLAKELGERGITHVHSPWATHDALIAMLAARLVDARYSVRARASDLHEDARQHGLAERLGNADLIFTNARYNEAPIRSKLPPGNPIPIHVIYEGVDLSRLCPPPRPRPRRGIPLLLCVARLVEPKGIEYLLRACQILREEGRAFRCEIVGGRVASETNYYIGVKKLHRALALDADVVFSGPRSFDRVVEKYAEADVYVLAAVQAADGRRDVTPNSVIEAMVMKLPVVATASGAIPELIENGISGLLVAPRDARELARAIARLLDDEAFAAGLAEAARRRVEERFDVAENAKTYARLFGAGTDPGVQRIGVAADSADRAGPLPSSTWRS